MIQYNKVEYNTIWLNVVHNRTIQFNSIQFITTQYDSMQYITEQFSSIQFITLHYKTIWFNVVQDRIIHLYTWQNSSVQFNTIHYLVSLTVTAEVAAATLVVSTASWALVFVLFNSRELTFWCSIWMTFCCSRHLFIVFSRMSEDYMSRIKYWKILLKRIKKRIKNEIVY